MKPALEQYVDQLILVVLGLSVTYSLHGLGDIGLIGPRRTAILRHRSRNAGVRRLHYSATLRRRLV